MIHPVSYTHLDVYKRQAIHCVNQFIVVRAVWRSEYLHILSGQLLDLFVHIHYLCLHLACSCLLYTSVYGTILTLIVIPCIYDAFNREKSMVEEEL